MVHSLAGLFSVRTSEKSRKNIPHHVVSMKIWVAIESTCSGLKFCLLCYINKEKREPANTVR